MDRKTIIILAVAVLFLCLLSPVVDHFFPPQPIPLSEILVSTNTTVETAPTAGTSTNPPEAAPIARATPATAPATQPSAPEQTLNMTNQDLVFQFTSYGGGLKSIALENYPAVVGRKPTRPDENNFATLNANAPVPVLGILENGAAGNDVFTLTRSNTTVRAEQTRSNGLRVIKTFEVGNNGTNFLFTANVRFENTSPNPLPLPKREVVIGTATPIGPLDDPTTLGTIWYNGTKPADIGMAWFANRTLGCIPGTPRTLFEDGASNVVWAATHSQYFALAAVPSQPAPSLSIRPIELPVPDTNGVTAPRAMFLTNGYQTAFQYPAVILPPNKSLDQSFTFYAGPKKYFDLSKIGQSMGNNLDLVMGFTGFLGFGFFSKMLLLSMNGIAQIGLPYGLCIIAITVVVKLVFWPLTAASTRSQKRLQTLQPQLKIIAEKYKDDALKKHEKTTEFMKEHKVNPMGSCLPMLIQIPVFYGFYSMLRNAIELRGVPFLWAHDLCRPDTVGYIAGFPINPLPLIMGATQLWQASMTPPQPGMDPGQQKLMRFMPVIFIAFFYNMSAGLVIYWTVSNLLTIAQTKFTKMGADPAAAIPATSGKKK
jgi:YidC/Oxa1 family membrane protein insertase